MLFLCLANSKKYGERCIAGIKVKIDKDAEDKTVWEEFPVKRDGSPKWVRPVSDREHGEVPTELVDSVSILDWVSLKKVTDAPQSYQCENIKFSGNFKVVGKFFPDASVEKRRELLDRFTSSPTLLFGNKGKAVHVDKIGTVSCSLVLIKVSTFELHIETNYAGGLQTRMKFEHNGTEYDLVVTDIDFLRKYDSNPAVLNGASHVYLAVV